MAGLAGIGVVVAGYLAVTKLAGGSVLLCTAGGGCETVQASRYAIFLGLPTAAWGAGLYAVIGGLALFGLPPRRWLAAFVLATSGVAFSAYLTYLSAFDLRALCGYCLVSAAVAVGLFGLLLARRPAPTGRRSPVRPARVVTWGVLAAAVTVAVGVGVYATEPPPGAAQYQEALARHLAGSGAVMYGAFW